MRPIGLQKGKYYNFYYVTLLGAVFGFLAVGAALCNCERLLSAAEVASNLQCAAIAWIDKNCNAVARVGVYVLTSLFKRYSETSIYSIHFEVRFVWLKRLYLS